jgi:hypothetical protein
VKKCAGLARDLYVGDRPVTCSDKPECTFDCNYPGSVEICSNGVDDDGNGLVDCDDPACQHGFSWSDAEAQSGRFSCLGTNQTGDKLGLSNYCAANVDPTVGLCCETGKWLQYTIGMWRCTATQPCLQPEGYCDYAYSAVNFTSWFADAGCLDKAEPSACCLVVEYGTEKYYSDVDNVKVY